MDGEWTELSDLNISVKRKTLHNTLSLSLPAKNADAFRFEVDPSYPYDVLQLLEVELYNQSGDILGAAEGAYAYIIDRDPQHTPPIIPAQQTYVMPLTNASGKTDYLWMGDLWGSAPDNIKGHDLQYWSAPLKFYSNGLIRPLRYQSEWNMQ